MDRSGEASNRHHVQLRSLASLAPDPRNPRRHSDKQLRLIENSIQAFGFNVPILVDRHGTVVAGHGRLLAARRLGYAEVPVISLDHLTPAQAKAFAIADNRLTEAGSWDDVLLGEIFTELGKLDLDFKLEDTGFTVAEIDLRIEAATKAAGGQTDPDNDLPALPDSARVVSTRGDVWELGPHRIICGDALETATYIQLLNGERAHVVFTDPPYNVRIQGHVSGNGRVQHREFAMASGEMSQAQFRGFLSSTFAQLAAHSHSGSIHFVCMDWRHLADAVAAGEDVYSELKNLCVWVKDNGGMGSFYRSQHELVLVFKHGDAPHRNNVQLGQYGRNRTNVWKYPSAQSQSHGAENLLALHPTVKPVSLIADALLDCSTRKDIVLDCFLGSGSTLLAAERVGRICRGIELDPAYVDVAIRRWQAVSEQKAIHAASGRSFSEEERRRRVAPIRAEMEAALAE